MSLMLPLLLACSPDAGPGPPPDDPGPADPVPPAPGELLIEELYTSGAVPAGGTDHYFSDQFVELVNAAAFPLDLAGVTIGDAVGLAGAINPGNVPNSYRGSHPNRVVLANAWRIPDGVVLEPGGRLLIAHDGVNHRPFSTIDLSGADLEAWVDSGNDLDSPTADNLEPLLFTGGFDWLMTVFGPSVVVLAADAGSRDLDGYLSAAAEDVLDGVDTLMDAGSGDFKRLPDAVDVGFAFTDGPYTGQSLHRKRDGQGWQDTNDSGADFEVGPPDPGLPPEVGAAGYGAWIELGTGTTTFAPVTDGQALELVAGPLGGWHLDVALRFGCFGPDGIALAYEALDDGANPVSFVTRTTLTSESVLPDGMDWIRLGDRVVLDVSGPDDVVGTELVLRVTAELGGQTWSDERLIVVADDEP